MDPEWWPDFELEFSSWIGEGEPAADSGQACGERQPLSGARPLTSHEKKRLSERIRGDIVKEAWVHMRPYAEDCLGPNSAYRQKYHWCLKAALAVFYRCSPSLRGRLSNLASAMESGHVTPEALSVLTREDGGGGAEAPSASQETAVRRQASTETPESSGDAAPSTKRPRAAPGSGRRRELTKNVTDVILAHCHSADEVRSALERVHCRLETEFPGEVFKASREIPLHKQAFLERMGELRVQCLNQNGHLDLEDLDRAVSANGTVPRASLAKWGYNIGLAAWSRVKEPEKTVKSKGGRPRIAEKGDVLELAEEVLGRHSKVSSKVATVRKSSVPGRFGRADGKVSEADKTHVQAMSLLARPKTIYEQEPALRSQMSLSTFRRVLQSHFGEFRVGARKTDMCSHCQKHDLLMNEWNEFKANSKQKLEQAMPQYFRHYDREGHASEAAKRLDFATEAKTLLKYISRHNRTYQAERRQLSRADQLNLYSFVEAPVEHEMKGFVAMLEAFQWHRLSARRQQEALQTLMDGSLPLEDTLVTYDWAEKIRLPLGPSETGAMWHAQQKLGVSCYASAVFRHKPGSTSENPKLAITYCIYVTDCLEQTAEASNFLLRQTLLDADVPQTGMLHLWSDCGPHFRSAENIHYYARELPAESILAAFWGIRWVRAICFFFLPWSFCKKW